MLADKDTAAVAAAMRPAVDAWIAVGVDGPRALDAGALAARIEPVVGVAVLSEPDVAAGCARAREMARPGDRVVVFGSFHTVGPALEWLGLSAEAG